MHSMIKKAGLAVALGATALTVAAPAEAQRYYGNRGYGNGYGHRNNGGTAVVAGIAGLAIGAAIASSANDRRYRDQYYDDRGYQPGYDDGYYQDHGYYPQNGYYAYRSRNNGYRSCSTRQVWDPYYRRNVRIRYC